MYTVLHYDPWGVPFPHHVLDHYSTLTWTRTENAVGVLILELPPIVTFAQFGRDTILVLQETTWGRARNPADTIWFVQRRRRVRNEDGELRYVITAVDANHLLTRRIIHAFAGTAGAEKTGPADNLMKQWVREQCITAINTDRRVPLTVDPDLGLAPSLTKGAAWEQVFDVLRDLADASAMQGTYLGFEIAARTPAEFLFRTYIGQRGVNRGSRSADSLILSAAGGALTNVEYDEDWSSLASTVVAGGAGEETARIIQAADDAAAAGIGPYGRIEQFYGANNDTPAAVLADARQELRARRSRVTLTATALDTPGVQYGTHYDYGYIVGIEDESGLFDARISSVTTTIGDTGAVSRDIQVRAL